MKDVIVRLLKENPDCNVWVTHLLEEKENGNLLIVAGAEEFEVNKDVFVKYEKLEEGDSRVLRGDVYSRGGRTCFIVSKKRAEEGEKPWDAGVSQRLCPPTQFAFSLEQDNLAFDLI